MYIRAVDISESVADKIAAKHAVSEREVYQVFENDEEPLVVRHSQKVRGTYVAYGCTFGGRYLVIPFELLDDQTARVLTAREMTGSERQLYRRAI